MSSAPETSTPDEEAAPGKEGRGRLLPVSGLTALLVVLVAAVAAVAIVQWQRAGDLTDERDIRREAASTAGAFAEALLTYDHADLSDARERVLALVTDEYADTYNEAFTVSLQPSILELKATSTAHVREVYVADASKERAKVIVVIDAEASSTAGTRNLIGTYLELELVRQGDKLLVNTVTALAAVDETFRTPDGEPATTSTTSAG